jgi:hypothetical protein
MCQQWDLRRDEVEASSLRADPRKHWSLFKSLSGKNSRPPPNQPISFKGKTHTKASAIARGFGRLFTSAAPHKSNKRARKVKRSLFSRHKLDPSFAPFSTADTLSAINAAKSSSAVGPDSLTAIHLKNLGHRGLEYLTKLFNLSVSNADLPAIWKAAVFIPVLKPGKPASEGASYRPILLLSPAVKVLELLLLPYVTADLPKAPSQHDQINKQNRRIVY